jgi:hypothetical protein
VTVFSNEACVHLNGCMGSQNDRYWSIENPMLIHKLPLHYFTVGVWCAMNANRINFYQTQNLQWYLTHILTPFFERLSDCERIFIFHQWDIGAAHIVNHSLHCLLSVFHERIISRWPWLSVQYIWICNFFYLWGMLKVKFMVITLAMQTVWKRALRMQCSQFRQQNFDVWTVYFVICCMSGSCRKPLLTPSVNLVSTESSSNCSALN